MVRSLITGPAALIHYSIRGENYFRYARTHFALDALDSHAATPDDPDRKVPDPARKTAAARVRQAGAAAQAAETARDGPGRRAAPAAQPRPRPGRLPHQPGDQRAGRPGRGRLPGAGGSRGRRGGRPGPGPARHPRGPEPGQRRAPAAPATTYTATGPGRASGRDWPACWPVTR